MPTPPHERDTTLAVPAQRALRRVRIEIGFRTMLLAGLAVGLCALLIALWPILVTIVVGLMILGMLAPSVAWLERRGLRRTWAISAVVVGISVSIGLLLLVLVPRLASQLWDILTHLPEAKLEVARRLEGFRWTAPFAESIRSAPTNDLVVDGGKALFAHSVAVAEVVAYGVSAYFLAIYLMIDRDRMRGAAFSLVPRRFHVRLSGFS